jgi:hypothetical protein
MPTLTVLASLICALPALASTADTASNSLKGRRDLDACMSRRMAADRMMSYNEASKTCKEQLAMRKPAAVQQLASNTANH